MFLFYFSLFLSAFLLTYSLFIPSKSIALMVGAIDYPNERKSHSTPTARLGGLSFFLSFSVLLLILPIDRSIKLPLLLGGGAMFTVGFLDDFIKLSPLAKLIGEFIAASIYILLSSRLSGGFSIIIGVAMLAWIIFITNAINLIDGLDMLAAGISAGQAICLFVIALAFGNYGIGLCLAVLFFAVLGFLPRNVPNAKIFMGDCGALFLGFILAALSSRLVFESANVLCLLAVLLIFRLPTADTSQSFTRRLVKKKNPFLADRGHFHHLLIKFGFSKDCAALALITVSLVFGFLGILMVSI